jgi:nanoRNase/pAp phosphatase (c-di-AMP/oligoRNAs hydrolase)
VDVPFADVRPWRGSVAAVLTEYLLAAELELTTQVATVVAFAIVSETEDFGRAASDEDVRVYMRILPHVDHRMLGQLRHPKVERSFFRTLARALKAAKVCRDVVACEIGPVNTPDEVPEVADFLNSMAGVRWVLCMGRFESRLLISLRTSDPLGGAAHLLMSSVGNIGSAGGHDMFAGGQVPLKRGDDSSEICRSVAQGVLATLGYDKNSTWEPLLDGS